MYITKRGAMLVPINGHWNDQDSNPHQIRTTNISYWMKEFIKTMQITSLWYSEKLSRS